MLLLKDDSGESDRMPYNHTVKENETIISIAEQYGFLPESIWEDDANEQLREKRKSPNILMADDILVIPDKKVVWHDATTGSCYRYCKKNISTKVSFRLMEGREPRSKLDCLLEIDGEAKVMTTGEKGEIEFLISPRTVEASLEISEEEAYDLSVGELDPVTEENGVRQRLINLGYLEENEDEEDDDEGEDEDLDVAIIRFKCEHCGLDLSPEDIIMCEEDDLYNSYIELDNAARDKLVEIHGS